MHDIGQMALVALSIALIGAACYGAGRGHGYVAGLGNGTKLRAENQRLRALVLSIWSDLTEMEPAEWHQQQASEMRDLGMEADRGRWTH